jgi:hypothetical protein
MDKLGEVVGIIFVLVGIPAALITGAVMATKDIRAWVKRSGGKAVILDFLGTPFTYGGALIVVGAIVLFGHDVLFWMKTGVWSMYTIGAWIQDEQIFFPRTDWWIVYKLYEAIWELPVALVLLIGGGIVSGIGFFILEYSEQKSRAHAYYSVTNQSSDTPESLPPRSRNRPPAR